MKVGKKIIALGIAYFLLGFSGNVFAEWNDEIAGKKISDYDGEIQRLEKSKDVNGLQNLLTIFKDDFAKADEIYSIAHKNVKGIENLIGRGPASSAETVLLTHPISGHKIDLSALDARHALLESREIKEKAYAKYRAIRELIGKTETALSRLGASVSSSSSSQH